MSFLNPKRKPLSWKPKRHGSRYCAPACGRGCTWEEYQHAIQCAKAMLKLVKGKGWRIDAWENYGWHWRIVNGGLQVNESTSIDQKGSKYWCLLSSEAKPRGGEMFWTDGENRHYSTPMLAIRSQLNRANQFTQFLQDNLDALNKRLKQ